MSSNKIEMILAGEHASIENTQAAALPVSFITADGCQFEMELMPGQMVGFTAGKTDAKIVLRGGDPAGLLIIKPESAS